MIKSLNLDSITLSMSSNKRVYYLLFSFLLENIFLNDNICTDSFCPCQQHIAGWIYQRQNKVNIQCINKAPLWLWRGELINLCSQNYVYDHRISSAVFFSLSVSLERFHTSLFCKHMCVSMYKIHIRIGKNGIFLSYALLWDMQMLPTQKGLGWNATNRRRIGYLMKMSTVTSTEQPTHSCKTSTFGWQSLLLGANKWTSYL